MKFSLSADARELIIRIPVQVISEFIAPRAAGEAQGLTLSLLTLREREVLRLLLEGRANKEIADALGRTERTAKFHVSRIFEKLQVTGRTELLRLYGMPRKDEQIDRRKK